MSRPISKPKPVSMSSAISNASRSPQASEILEHDLIAENESEISMEELQEFMSADLFEVPADPTFKDRLREKLRELVHSNYGGPDKK